MPLHRSSNGSLRQSLAIAFAFLMGMAIDVFLRFWVQPISIEGNEVVVGLNRVLTLEEIATDPTSSISDDIVSITHNAIRSVVTVELKNTRCPFPVLRGRLSGPAIVTLDWSFITSDIKHLTKVVTASQLEGHYRAPLNGTYFLEVLIIQCSTSQFNDDFKNTCLENPLHNRITDQGVTIQVHNAQTIPLGYWVSKKKKHEPLYTRFQPINCRKNTSDSHLDRCTLPTSLSRFDDYEFVWQSFNSLGTEEMITRDINTTICFVGDSHSRVLVEATRILAARRNASHHLEVHHPDDVVLPKLEETVAKLKCTAVVLGIGSWSAGWPRGIPLLFPDYKIEMSRIISGMTNITNAFVRSVPYVGLEELLITCPPKDWRSPRVIDMYNGILREVCKEHGVPFIDTNILLGSIWDSADDFCHFSRMGGKEEALYIASIALGLESFGNKI